MSQGTGSLPKRTLDTAEGILHARYLDRILGYIGMKMDVALATNNELSSTRTQIVQMASFLLVAFVIGTGGVDSLRNWSQTSLVTAFFSSFFVILIALRVTTVSTRYTDIVMEEFHGLETIYSMIVWEELDDIEALKIAISEIEKGTREKIDFENARHRILTGTILHSMIHYERHSPFDDDIGFAKHNLSFSNSKSEN